MSTTAAKPTANAEQLADLAALQAAATESDLATQAQPGQANPPPVQPPSAAALQLAALVVGIARPILAAALPQLRAAPDPLWEPVPEGVAAILDHYGLNKPDLLASPWARLAMSLAPLAAFAAMEAMKEDKPKEKPTQALPAATQGQDQPPTPTSKAVTVGTVMPAEAA